MPTLALRDKIPARRSKPTKNPKKNWSAHKPDLREDFHRHCAYCFSNDAFRDTYFEVDHFVPRFIIQKSRKISLTEYSNLVYSCRFCNNNKRAQWPSKRITVYNNGKEGFVDPCTKEIDKHLYRTKDGGIMWRTKLGKWMFNTAFKFDERQEEIKLLWKLNRLKKTMEKLILIKGKTPKNSRTYKGIEGL